MQCSVMQRRENSMISLVMRHLMAVPVEQADLIFPVWIWEISLGIFSEISSAVDQEDVAMMDR